MEMANNNIEKEAWRERFEWEIESPLQAVWELTRDFVNIHKWTPSLLANSSLVEGSPQQPGCVRLAEGHPVPSVEGDDRLSSPGPHAFEKLLEIDHLAHKLTYVVTQASIPFLVGLTPSFQLVEASPTSTKVIWSYEIAPVSGFDRAALRNFLLSNFYEAFINDLKKMLSRPIE